MHELTLASQYGDRIVLVNGGRIVAEGAPAEVLTAERLEALYGARVRIVDPLPQQLTTVDHVDRGAIQNVFVGEITPQWIVAIQAADRFECERLQAPRPERFMVAAKVEFADGLTADDIEQVADEAERRLVAAIPGIEMVFLDPTRNQLDRATGSGTEPGT